MTTTNVLLGLTIILVASKIGGVVSTKVHLPPVFGQLCAGVVLGPAAFGILHSSNLLDIGSALGVIMLMFVAGLETDVQQMRRVGVAAFVSASGGVILPFAAGVALARLFGLDLLASLFVGTLLTATSVSISVQTLQELGRLRTREGTTILGAAVIDDVLGLIVLSVVIAYGGGQGGLLPIAKMVIFFPLAIVVGIKVVPHLGAWAAKLTHEGAGLAMAMLIALAYAWTAQSFGNVAAITGAYIAGLVVARTDVAAHAIDGAKAIGYGLLIPVFFISVGVQANVNSLGGAPLFIAILILVAIVTKAAGCALGAMACGFAPHEATRVGVGMISRGEVALVVGTVGYQAHVINNSIYAASIVLALATTLITPILLRMVYAETRPSEEGREVVGHLLSQAAGD